LAKALHPGHAADAGLMAAMAAAAGFSGSMNSLHADDGFAAATSDTSGDWKTALSGLGDWTPITKMTVKAHGCCGHIFPAVDGLAHMNGQHHFEPADFVSIDVFGYRATETMCNRPRPVSAQEARFSLQYCAAAFLVLGAVRLDAFDAETLERADIRGLMSKIAIFEDPLLSAEYPRQRQARLRIALSDGRILEHFQRTRRGDPEDPLGDGEIAEKFRELASGILSEQDSAACLDNILHGTQVPGRLEIARGVREDVRRS
jgi:2-methylcitrate dehydratase PrpD